MLERRGVNKVGDVSDEVGDEEEEGLSGWMRMRMIEPMEGVVMDMLEDQRILSGCEGSGRWVS